MAEKSDGLDLSSVSAALPSTHSIIDRQAALIDEHLERHAGYLAWSGGRDSTAVLALARLVRPDVPVVWFDSGLEFPETRIYIQQLAESLSLNLDIIPSTPDALTVLQESGYWDHATRFGNGDDLHNVLITEPARLAHERWGRGELTGLRADESVGRRILLSSDEGHYTRSDGTIVFAPLWAYTAMRVRGTLKALGVPENPVYSKLASLGAPERAQRVGLVVDGNNAENGRYTYLRNGWPELWEQLVQSLPRLNEWR